MYWTAGDSCAHVLDWCRIRQDRDGRKRLVTLAPRMSLLDTVVRFVELDDTGKQVQLTLFPPFSAACLCVSCVQRFGARGYQCLRQVCQKYTMQWRTRQKLCHHCAWNQMT